MTCHDLSRFCDVVAGRAGNVRGSWGAAGEDAGPIEGHHVACGKREDFAGRGRRGRRPYRGASRGVREKGRFRGARPAGTPALSRGSRGETFWRFRRFSRMPPLQLLPIRKKPATDMPGLIESFSVVFLTVCSQGRSTILANEAMHHMLITLWSETSQWRVGRYVIMPDHIHLFARQHSCTSASLLQWVAWWKRSASISFGRSEGSTWQRGAWSHRIYSRKAYENKVEYVGLNPVRAGLVHDPAAWPYQGVINTLRWPIE
jgi:putative transposase